MKNLWHRHCIRCYVWVVSGGNGKLEYSCYCAICLGFVEHIQQHPLKRDKLFHAKTEENNFVYIAA